MNLLQLLPYMYVTVTIALLIILSVGVIIAVVRKPKQGWIEDIESGTSDTSERNRQWCCCIGCRNNRIRPNGNIDPDVQTNITPENGREDQQQEDETPHNVLVSDTGPLADERSAKQDQINVKKRQSDLPKEEKDSYSTMVDHVTAGSSTRQEKTPNDIPLASQNNVKTTPSHNASMNGKTKTQPLIEECDGVISVPVATCMSREKNDSISSNSKTETHSSYGQNNTSSNIIPENGREDQQKSNQAIHDRPLTTKGNETPRNVRVHVSDTRPLDDEHSARKNVTPRQSDLSKEEKDSYSTMIDHVTAGSSTGQEKTPNDIPLASQNNVKTISSHYASMNGESKTQQLNEECNSVISVPVTMSSEENDRISSNSKTETHSSYGQNNTSSLSDSKESSDQELRTFVSDIADEILETFKQTQKKKLPTVVLTNKYQRHKSIKEFCKADQIYVDSLWISNSPKRDESDTLIQHYSGSKTSKPDLYIGRVYMYTADDRQGLKNLVNKGFTLQAWGEVSSEIYTRYNDHIRLYIKSVIEESKESPDQEKDDYTQEAIVPIAVGEIGITHLLDDRGRLYRSRLYNCNSYMYEQEHAERVFKNNLHGDPARIRKIWLKSSPCSSCSKLLIKMYSKVPKKPEICIGHIYKPGVEVDKQGMNNLKDNGFNVSLWDNFYKTKYGNLNKNKREFFFSQLYL